MSSSTVQYPLDIATLDIATALPIATSSPMELCHYINSDSAGYSDLNRRDGGQSLYPMCTVVHSQVLFKLWLVGNLKKAGEKTRSY